jgi:2-oxoisovalerate dehydrogenase E1 component
LEKFNERVVNRINFFFDDILSKDKSVIFLGEDILSPYGGAFKVANNLSLKYPDNVISTPISEQAITGLSNGLALKGFRPYLEIMFGDFITLSMDQIINHASKFYHMYNKKVHCPIVIRTPMGGGRGYGPTHSQTLDKILSGINNVTLVALNSFIDPLIIFEEIHKNEKHPVIVIENKIDYANIVGNKNNDKYKMERSLSSYPVVKCTPIIAAPSITIVSYGGIASDVFDNLLDIFIETEQLPELIVLSKISPLDLQSVFISVKNTRKLIVIEEGGLEFGIGSEIISSVVENLGTNNIDLAQRIGALSVPIPSSKTLEENVLPNKSIIKKIKEKMRI